MRRQVLMREEVEILVVEEIDVPTGFSLCFSGLSVSMIMMNRLMTSYENDNSVQPHLTRIVVPIVFACFSSSRVRMRLPIIR
jgi:hypothetical protein